MGMWNWAVADSAASQGMSLDMWDVDPEDWRGGPAEAITAYILEHTRSGDVILLHVLRDNTVSALPQIIDGLRDAGFTFG
jgi:peptidoglycan/xylan/chitin deacetylase (PgdA/CDA1 family)